MSDSRQTKSKGHPTNLFLHVIGGAVVAFTLTAFSWISLNVGLGDPFREPMQFLGALLLLPGVPLAIPLALVLLPQGIHSDGLMDLLYSCSWIAYFALYIGGIRRYQRRMGDRLN